MKQVLQDQYGDLLPTNIEVGYFNQRKKMWIKNRLDMEVVWKLVDKGERVTLWSMGPDNTSTQEKHAGSKRSCDEGTDETQLPTKKSKKQTGADERRALAEEYERQLEAKHQAKNYSKFQLKIWAKALAAKQHTDSENPLGYAMLGVKMVL